MRRYTAIILLLLACSGTEPDVPPDPGISAEEIRAARAAWPAGFAAAIDSANQAYGAQQFDRAAELFRRAVTMSPEISAGWYGVYIAEHARGNVAAADSALAIATDLSSDGSAPDFTASDGAM